MPTIIRKGLLKRIHVNQHIIKANHKRGPDDVEPPLSIKTYRNTTQAFEVEIHGPSTVIYRPDKPLSCGAHVWIETRSEVHVTTKESD